MSRSLNIATGGLLLTLGMLGAGASVAQHVSLPRASVSTPLGSGPFKVIPSTDPRLPDHTIYLPPKLSVLGKSKLPIVVWGVGGCLDKGTWFRWFLSEIASHGYLVVSNGQMGALEDQTWRPVAPPKSQPLPDPARVPRPATTTAQLIEAIDWASAENARRGSPFFGRFNTSKIAVMGMSCGGIQAIQAGADPRVTTTVAWNIGLFPDATGMNAVVGGESLTKSALSRLHGSVAYISGGESDVGFENANDDFSRLHGVPAFRAYRKDTTHEGTYWEKDGGEFGRIAVAWLNWRLKGDQRAARMFVGPDCDLCRNPRWSVEQKDLRR